MFQNIPRVLPTSHSLRTNSTLVCVLLGVMFILVGCQQATGDIPANVQTARAERDDIIQQLETCEAERELDSQNERESLSKQLIAESKNWKEQDIDVSMLLAVQAHNVFDMEESEYALRYSIHDSQYMSATLRKHKSMVRQLAFSSDGKMLVSADYAGNVMQWDVHTWQHIDTPLRLQTAARVVLSPHGQWLASWARDIPDTVHIWNVATGQRVGSIVRDEFSIEGAVFSPDEQMLALWLLRDMENIIVLWDVATQQPVGKPLQEDIGVFRISSVAFSPDGKTLAAARGNSTRWSIRLWGVDGQPIGSQMDVQTGFRPYIAFTPDGQNLVSVAENSIRLWDVATRQPVGPAKKLNDCSVSTIALSPDGHTLAVGCESQRIFLVDVQSQDIRSRLVRREGDLNHLAFSPDSMILASASHLSTDITVFHTQGQIQLWDLRSIDTMSTIPIVLKQRLCHAVGRNFTVEEWHRHMGNRPYETTCPELPIHESVTIAVVDRAQQGDKKARHGDIEGAMVDYDKVLTFDPTLDMDPYKRATEMYATALIRQAVQSARYGGFITVTTELSKAMDIAPTLEISADSWAALCRGGSVWGHASQVLYTCEHATMLAPNQPIFRDYRGIARALTGDSNGAIEDFSFFVAHGGDAPYNATADAREQRREWIKALKQGDNPFTEDVLYELRQ